MSSHLAQWEPGPNLWRIPGRPYSPDKPQSSKHWTFLAAGALEGFEIWTPELIPAYDSRTLIELLIDFRIDSAPFENLDAVARFRQLQMQGR